jgi:glycosyltransferase involved in cell wall biosynthesis
VANIGTDASPLQNLNGGISFYLFYLLDELIKLRPEDTFYLFITKETEALNHFKQYPNVVFKSYSTYSLGHSIWSQTFLAFACIKYKIDLFYGPSPSIPLIKRPAMKTLLTLHDFVYRLHPETMPLVSRVYFTLFARLLLNSANAIIAVSKGTSAKLTQFYGLSANEIIEPPLKTTLQPQEVPKSYLITVGTLEPRKNLQRLLQVYLQTLKTMPTDQVLPLLIVGSGGWKNKLLLKTLQEAQSNYPNHIRPLGFVPDSQLAHLLSGARYCLMMSKYEGYGMPLAESRLCGTPVICTDQEEMREAAENDGIFLPDPWESHIVPYFLKAIKPVSLKSPNYPSNKTKAIRLSNLINHLLTNTLTID